MGPGPGTYRVDGRLYASVLGLLQERPPVVQVIPLSGRYIPRGGDVVVGTVTDVQPTFWLLNIGAPRWAPLHMTGTPWTIDYGETKEYLRVGDAVVVAVETIEATGRIGVTMMGPGLGKLEGGTLETISPAKVPRLIGRGGSMIQMIQKYTGTTLVVGQNGRVWLDGPPEGVTRAHRCLTIIDEEGQRSGLTDRMSEFLTSEVPPEEVARLAAERQAHPTNPFPSMPPPPPRGERDERPRREGRHEGPRRERGAHDEERGRRRGRGRHRGPRRSESDHE